MKNAFLFAFSWVVAIAASYGTSHADEVIIQERVGGKESPFKAKTTLRNILILDNNQLPSPDTPVPADVSLFAYWTIEGDRIVLKTSYGGNGEYRRTTMKRSNAEERSALIAKWAGKLCVAELEQSVGGPIQLLSPTIKYPLPMNVTYIGIGGGPATINAPEIYFGEDSKSAAKVQLSKIRQLSITGHDSASVTWVDGRKTEERYLPSWKYGEYLGQPPVVAGYDPITLEKREYAIAGLKTVRFQSPSTVSCSDSPDHAFGATPASWKYCPICGAPLKLKESKKPASKSVKK